MYWVEQNYLRAATLTAANAALVDFHSGLELAKAWGGGELASADGLRFVVPVKTINAGPNTKYFGKGKGARGVTYYNFTSDQFTGFHGIVIPGTPKDWYYILEGLLDQETSLKPTEITSDTAGAPEIAFGIFRLMGWQFSPRLADVGSATLFRADAAAHYGTIDALVHTRVNTQLNRQEARHTLARKIFHGQKGELRRKYKEGREDQLGALGFMTNVCIRGTPSTPPAP